MVLTTWSLTPSRAKDKHAVMTSKIMADELLTCYSEACNSD